MKALLIDNYDSFTFMLKDYIEQCGATCEVVRNDNINTESVLHQKPEAVIISPGSGTPENSGSLMAVLKEITSIPILGICLGHQAIGELFGATLQKAKTPKHGKVETIEHYGNPIFKSVPKHFEATRYHSLILNNLPEQLEITAHSATGEIMGIAHKQLPLYGIQFHPESCMTEHGLILIRNFLIVAKRLAAT